MAGKAKGKKRGTNGHNGKKGALLAAAAVCLAAVVLLLIVLLPGAGGNPATGSEEGQTDGSGGVQAVSAGESLRIPLDGLSETVAFYPVEVDGTPMEVLAVVDSRGTIRMAYNTCQICYSSGRGYYVQEGSELVCQNCGNRFTVDQIEVETGGCNPVPIFPEERTQTDTEILLSYEQLKEAAQIFANWKTFG